MRREEFKLLCDSRVVLLDGATGTNLQKAGMPAGVCPELWMVEPEDAVRELQMDFLEAGTDILYAPTFSANRIKLEEYGLVIKSIVLFKLPSNSALLIPFRELIKLVICFLVILMLFSLANFSNSFVTSSLTLSVPYCVISGFLPKA